MPRIYPCKAADAIGGFAQTNPKNGQGVSKKDFIVEIVDSRFVVQACDLCNLLRSSASISHIDYNLVWFRIIWQYHFNMFTGYIRHCMTD